MSKHKSKKIKLERTKADDNGERLGISPMEYSTAQLAQRELMPSRISFLSEVTSMLYAYGDVRHPLKETATLVDEIVHQQMCQLLNAAAQVAHTRSSSVLGLEEFLFLLRRNKLKLSRFMTRMRFLDTHPKKILGSSGQENEGKDEELDQEEIASHDPDAKKSDRWTTCCNFLGAIDETGDFKEILENPPKDTVKQKRMERAEKKTRDMDADEYMEFVKCRQISFSSIKVTQKNKPKFRDWFDFNALQLNVTPSNQGWEALEYLAQETLGEIVDLALIVRSENLPPLLPCESEPNSRHMPVYSSSSLTDRAEVLSSLGEKNIKTEAECENDSTGRSKTETSSSGGLNRKLALTPQHIREALRRFNTPSTKKSFLAKVTSVLTTEPDQKLICLI